MSLKRRITNLEADMKAVTEPALAFIFMDGRIEYCGREITPEELEQLPVDSQGFRAVDFRGPE